MIKKSMTALLVFLIMQAVIADDGLKLVTVLVEGGEPVSSQLYYEVYVAQKDLEGKRKRVSYSYKPQPVFNLSKGKYYVTVQHGSAFIGEEIEIKANEGIEKTLILNAGYLRVTAIPKADAKPLSNKLYYEVYTVQKDLEGKRKRVTYSYEAQPLFRLPEGKYYVTVAHGSARTSGVVVVKAGEQTEQILNLNVGYLLLSAIPKADAKPLSNKLYYEVYTVQKDLEGKRKRVTYSYEAQPLFRLLEGKYYVTVAHGSARTSGVVVVKAGQRKELSLIISYQ